MVVFLTLVVVMPFLLFAAAIQPITGTAIADASIGIGNDEGGPECRLDLSGMVASESEITGNWQFVDGDANSDAIACGGMFAAALGGDFPTTASCANQLITTNT